MAVEEAAANAQLQILDWLYENDPLVCWGIYAYRKAMNNGHLTVLKWLNERFPVPPDDVLLMVAIDLNQKLIVQWFWLVAILNDWPLEILPEALSASPLQVCISSVQRYGRRWTMRHTGVMKNG
ncbi:hypothetical protein PR003_g12896 [Phytophthora rubi]|uniref:Uncharacterized protein n=1 Tax=Phytophthora rubi TaxID=129364 RepID=A0A6A3LND2_9STRA|nr:hypothetical protein PR002_g12425 [Phytophthora rubi]KAE9024616.1 hypothetical protein PR001_g12633 [Phytophthora rubi]KAE9335683.1 hypothetical protein PR003_g12896 [Phytophthora rubi]